MTKIFFVRHAQPDFSIHDDGIRPLTAEGKQDAKEVLEFLKDKKIDEFYCSPFKRSYDTILETAQYFKKDIIIDERLRERKNGIGSNNHEMFRKRWENRDFHEEEGESIHMVQKRNMEALNEILQNNQNKTIVIGTHGTALGTILAFYDAEFNCDSFLRFIDWMPYIIELDFEESQLIKKVEHIHIEKEFKGKK